MPQGFEEELRTNFNRVGNFQGVEHGLARSDVDAGFRRPGNKKSNDPAARHRMWSEKREGIGVTAVQESVDFGVIGVWYGNRLRGCAALLLRFLRFSRLLRQRRL